MHPVGRELAWLAHPVTVVAIALLTVNDHVLKAAYPGLLTGKLSDVAGLMVAPPLLAVALALLTHRRSGAAAVIATGIGFALVKGTGMGAEVASEAWSALVGPSRILADPTDLLALPALAASWCVRRRTLGFFVPERPLRLARLLLVLPMAVLAVAATSAPFYPNASQVTVWRGMVAADVDNGFHARRVNGLSLVTLDGIFWRSATTEEREAFRAAAETTSCVPGRCYRTVPGRLRVEQSADEGRTWNLAWEVSEGRRSFLGRGYSQPQKGGLSSASIAAIQVSGGGHVVVVANRRDGFAVRDASGQWRRIGFPRQEGATAAQPVTRRYDDGGQPPPPLVAGNERIAGEKALGLGLGVLAAFVALTVAGRRRHLWTTLPAATTLLGLYLLPGSPYLEFPLAAMGFTLGLGLVGGSAVAWSMLLWWRGPGPRARATVACAVTGALTAAGVIVPFVGWSNGMIDGYRTAALLAVALGATGFAATLGAALLLRGPRQPQE